MGGDGALQIVWGADPHLTVSGGDPEVCGVYKLDPTDPLYNTVGIFYKDGKRNSGNTELWWNEGQWRLGLWGDYWAVMDAPIKTPYPPVGGVWTTKKGGGELQIVWHND